MSDRVRRVFGSGILLVAGLALALAPGCRRRSGGGGAGVQVLGNLAFRARIDLATGGTGIADVVFADLDGDGRLDLVVACGLAGGVRVRLGTGPGQFVAPAQAVVLPVGTAIDLEVGDFVGSGFPDIAVIDWNPPGPPPIVPQVRLFENQGGGVFVETTPVAAGSDPVSLTLADLDGDADLDLVVAGSVEETVRAFENQGGAFALAWTATLPAGAIPLAAAAGSLGGGAAPDLAFADAGRDLLLVFLDPGILAPPAPTELATGAGPFALALADADGDLDLDLLAACYGEESVRVHANDGAGQFPAGLVQVVLFPGSNPAAVAAADLDGDSILDLLVASPSTSTVSLRKGLAGGGFGPEAGYAVGYGPFRLAVADATGDGILDVASANASDADVSVLPGAAGIVPEGTLAAARTFLGGSAPYFVAAGDFDGDGVYDAAYSDALGQRVLFLRGLGNGNLAPGGEVALAGDPGYGASLDWDGDGDLDLVVAVSAANAIALLRNDGAFQFSLAGTIVVGLFPLQISIGALGGDARPDLGVAIPGNGSVAFLRGTAAFPFFASETTVTVGTGVASGPVGVVFADFDGDGDLDVASTNNGDGTVSVLRNDGNFAFPVVATQLVGSLPTWARAADLDRDGDPDLVVSTSGENFLRILRNDGSFQFVALTQALPGGGRPTALFATDLDRDGVLDVFVAEGIGGNFRILRGLGSLLGNDPLAPLAPFPGVTACTSAVLVDLDGDSLPDVLAESHFSSKVLVARNLSTP